MVGGLEASGAKPLCALGSLSGQRVAGGLAVERTSPGSAPMLRARPPDRRRFETTDRRAGSGRTSGSCLVIRPVRRVPLAAWPPARSPSRTSTSSTTTFRGREPYEVFELLQREAPVYWHPEPGGRRLWCVTRYDDVVHVLKNARVFSREADGAARIDRMEADVLGRAATSWRPTRRATRSGGACSRATSRRGRWRYTDYLVEVTDRSSTRRSEGRVRLRPGGRRADPDPRARPHPRRAGRAPRPLVELGDRMLVHTDPDLTPPGRRGGGVEVPAVRARRPARSSRARPAADRGPQGPSQRRRPLDPRERPDRRLPDRSSTSTTTSPSSWSPATRRPARAWRSGCSR